MEWNRSTLSVRKACDRRLTPKHVHCCFYCRKEIFRFVTSDCRNLGYTDDERLDYDEIVCFECKREPNLLARICLLCKHNTTTFCTDHFRNDCKTCKIHGHSGTPLCWIKEHHIKTNFLSLKEMSLDDFESRTRACTDHAMKLNTKRKRGARRKPQKKFKKRRWCLGRILRSIVTAFKPI